MQTNNGTVERASAEAIFLKFRAQLKDTKQLQAAECSREIENGENAHPAPNGKESRIFLFILGSEKEMNDNRTQNSSRNSRHAKLKLII